MGAIYFISPVDLIPDLLLPYLGWLDDAFIVGLILYYLKNGRLPPFLNNQTIGRFFKSKASPKAAYRQAQYRGAPPNENRAKQNRSQESEGGASTKRNAESTHREEPGRSQYSDRTSSYGKSGSPPNGKGATGKSKSPHEILGIGADATQEEILAAYRKGVKAYHPDRVAHLGEDLQRLANERFIEIKAAYQTLSKRS